MCIRDRFKDGRVVSVQKPEDILNNNEIDDYTEHLWAAQPINDFMEVAR